MGTKNSNGPNRIALAAAACTTAALAAGVSGCGWTTDAHIENDATFTEPLHAIRIETGAGEVVVRKGDAALGVTVRRDINYNGGQPPTPGQALADGTLTLTSNCTDCGIAYDVTVPETTAVTVVDHAGHVTLDGLAGPIDVSASAGRVEGRHLASPQVTIQAAAGAIDLDFATPPADVTARSHAGEVTVSVPGGPYAIDATAKAGHRTVEVAADPASTHRLTVWSDAGAVTVQPD